jgi:pimeloyl-ACP methyl ester carboxylesterase
MCTNVHEKSACTRDVPRVTRSLRRYDPCMRAPILATLVTLALPSLAHADDELVERPLGSTDAPYGHLEYTPPGYDDGAGKYPVILFLHGAGESGDGVTNLWGAMTAHGPAKLIEQGDTYFADGGFLVFSPQSPGWWDQNQIHEFLGYIAASFRVDPRRVYITGLSMGGGGTWNYASAHPGRASAVLPICGAAGPGNGMPFVGVPTWAFHSWGDGTVLRWESIGWVDNIADAIAGVDVPTVLTGYPNMNGDPNLAAATDMTASFDGAAFAWNEGIEVTPESQLRLTLYNDNSHDSWTRTYDEPTNWDWLVGNSKPLALDDDTYIIDNLDSGAAFTGEWTRSEAVAGFYWWDYHELAAGPDVYASFATDLPPAIYEVYVSWTAGADRAQVDASIDGALEAPAPFALDMTQGGGFTSLGQFTFDMGVGEVTLRGQDGQTGLVVADAVGFVYRGEIPGADTTGGADEGTSSAGDDESGEGSASLTGDSDPTSSPTTTTSTSAADESGDTSGGTAEDDEASGCGCKQRSGAGAWWLGGLVLVAMRRRRDD